jgi:hypothetical protein
MSYKGNDLYLRTPYAYDGYEDGAAQASLSLLAEPGREGPITVDHTVLACFNAAYDTAVFHGTRDVQIVHLLYALTRVEAARDVLEQHGIRCQELRRDAAAAIASDAPASVPGRVPRTSADLIHVLRRAAGRASHDGVPVSVHDVLRAVLSCGRETTAALLLRSANDPQRLERWGAEPPQQALFAAPQQPALAQELLGRLEAMETGMRTLAVDAAADRKAMLELMGEIQRELRATRQESAATPTMVLDKIEDVGTSMVGLTERFESLEASVPGDALVQRFTALEGKLSQQPSAIAEALAFLLDERQAAAQKANADSWDTLAEKLAGLEALVRAQYTRMDGASKNHERDLNEIFEGLVKLGANQQTLANNLESWRLDNSGDVSIVSNRLQNLESMLQKTLFPPTRGEDAGNGVRGGLKRWLYGTTRVLPLSWRDDTAAVRDSYRTQRDAEKT